MKSLTFMRYGGLKPVKQKGYSNNFETFNQPPARKGIYAFVKGTVEHFLVYGDATLKKMPYARDKKGTKLEHKTLTKPKFFHHHGHVWHHLSRFLKDDEILEERGAWVKTTWQVHMREYYRCRHAEVKHHMTHTLEFGKDGIEWVKKLNSHPTIPSRDGFEVFIERIK